MRAPARVLDHAEPEQASLSTVMRTCAVPLVEPRRRSRSHVLKCADSSLRAHPRLRLAHPRTSSTGQYGPRMRRAAVSARTSSPSPEPAATHYPPQRPPFLFRPARAFPRLAIFRRLDPHPLHDALEPADRFSIRRQRARHVIPLIHLHRPLREVQRSLQQVPRGRPGRFGCTTWTGRLTLSRQRRGRGERMRHVTRAARCRRG